MDRPCNRLHYPNMELIPTYALYGEQESKQDWLHWETIPARSQGHDFRIAPHRHDHLFQVLSLTAGTARVVLDGAAIRLVAGEIVVVPALVVHGYVFSPDVDGLVLTLFERDVRALDLGFEHAAILRTGAFAVMQAMERLIDEADNPGERHELAMRAHLTLLLLTLHRAHSQAVAGDGRTDRTRLHAAAFRQLVERRFRQTRRIADYAGEIGVSPAHLNRISRQVLGASALAVIERRIALEARRQLLFSTLPIKQIGAELGYDDPAYFTRFITRMLGLSPAAFRQKMRRA
ncbi:helix-turn-helix domain-containing protein [Devosia sp. YIM 151766]|uniref:helix-turn-helix domain-containing protein n=1 Tax=Devosia sp. YIM 151766 TaxID=3017325 RepID=UPI00255CD2B9|nr:helix-turn-helix domain-containing protein [Devosia sp. YIM 151766]WIY53181.1 helix-turn-helix domain-containing protein [Devosia sp. YIM 151766]